MKHTAILLYLFLIPTQSSQAMDLPRLKPPTIKTSWLSSKVRRRRAPNLQKQFTQKGLSWGSPIYLRLFKHSKELELWVKGSNNYTLFKTYPICEFSGAVGPKQKKGDQQAPEGFYSIQAGSLNPYSGYHLSFNVGYPNSYDRFHNRTGGLIMVHGDCVSVGCFAMTNPVIEEIYAILESTFLHGAVKVPMHIFPFRFTLLNKWRYQ